MILNIKLVNFHQVNSALLEYLKWSEVKVAQSCPTLCNPMDYTVHGILQARILEWVVFPFSRGSPQPQDRIHVFHTADRFFTSWATREPKNTAVGSLSLLRWIFPTQESNLGLLHCRWILYHLSYEGSLEFGFYNILTIDKNRLLWLDQ